MRGKYLLASVTEPASVDELSGAISRWDPLISLLLSESPFLYDGVRTVYGLCVGGSTQVSFGGRRERVERGDALVVAPGVRVSLEPATAFLCICDEGLAPEPLRSTGPQPLGYQHFKLDRDKQERSICGRRTLVIPEDDVRYRVQYHFVQTSSATPHKHEQMLELLVVLEGEGLVRLGPAEQELTEERVEPGTVVAVGPGLFHVPTDGLGICVWFVYEEVAHLRRRRERLQKQQ